MALSNQAGLAAIRADVSAHLVIRLQAGCCQCVRLQRLSVHGKVGMRLTAAGCAANSSSSTHHDGFDEMRCGRD